VRRSRVLAELLHATLRVGNFMNYGSRQGGAVGFRLSLLIKLSLTRGGASGATTLADFIVRGCVGM
jgi:hypothetical protein